MTSTRRSALPALLVTIAAIACAGDDGGETWGFVATLGNDTTSVERITRAGDRIVSEAVGRSPLVVRRRWEATLAPDGSVQRWTIDTHIPNAPPGETDLHHELELTADAIRVVRQTGRDSTTRSFAHSYARTVPWNAFLYGTWELLFQVARGLPDSTRIAQYFFEGWSEGNFGWARVLQLGDGRVAISSTGLAGSGEAQLDEQGRLLSYSGKGTTYLHEVRRIDGVPDIDAIFERFTAAERAQGPARVLSARDTSRATIGAATMVIDYGRPLARGRTLLGGVIPLGVVWRTGANAATHLTISAPLRIAGVPLDSGTFTLWTLPTASSVQLVINHQTGQWGTGYQAGHDVARAALQVDTLDTPIERFTIRVDTTSARLVMEWGTFRWSAPIEPR